MHKWQISTAFAGFGAVLAQLYGGWDSMLQLLVAFVVIDYVTGVTAAIYQWKLSSAVGYKGIMKKVSIFAIVLVACLISNHMGDDTIRAATMWFYIGNELVSILENVGKTNVKYPEKLKQILAQLNEKNK
jgi:toxin secretion/phage lysis holin